MNRIQRVMRAAAQAAIGGQENEPDGDNGDDDNDNDEDYQPERGVTSLINLSSDDDDVAVVSMANDGNSNQAPDGAGPSTSNADANEDLDQSIVVRRSKRRRLTHGDSSEEDEGDEKDVKAGASKPSTSAPAVDLDQTEDSDSCCTICFEQFTSHGKHRLVSLKCGHFFGDECIRRWMSGERQPNCPQCKKKARATEIRFHYARIARVADNSELEEARQKLTASRRESDELRLQVNVLQERNRVLANELKEATEFREQLKRMQQAGILTSSAIQNVVVRRKFFIKNMKNMPLGENASCRALAHNATAHLAVAFRQPSSLFHPYSLKIIPHRKLPIVLPLHRLRPRAVAFSPACQMTTLSTGDDKHACLATFDSVANTGRLVRDVTLPAPGYSCAMSHETAFIGISDGRVVAFSMAAAEAGAPDLQFLTTGDDRPVTAVAWNEQYRLLLAATQRRVVALRGDRLFLLYEESNDQLQLNSVAFDPEARNFMLTLSPKYSAQPQNIRYTLHEIVVEDGDNVTAKELSSLTSASMTLPRCVRHSLVRALDKRLLGVVFEQDQERVLVFDWADHQYQQHCAAPRDTLAVQQLDLSTDRRVHIGVLTELALQVLAVELGPA